jgi:hypothetical protein
MFRGKTPLFSDDNLDSNLDETINNLIYSMESKIFLKKSNKRVKRFDRQMINDCSSHETGLAIGLYSLFIRNHYNFLINDEL